MKRFIALFLAVLLCLSLAVTGAFASDSGTNSRADSLNALGLFLGGSNGYELESNPTRAQALTMLIRLLGKEDEALKGGYSHPFKDNIPGWAEPYVAYAYETGLTKGVSLAPDKEAFDCSSTVTAQSYMIFLLRALGYDDSAGDFDWRRAMEKGLEIGMITPDGIDSLTSRAFTRGDMVDLSCAALARAMNGSSVTLSGSLVSAGVYSAALEAKHVDFSYVYGAVAPSEETVSYERRTIATSEGNVTADILTINVANPRVRVEPVLSGKTINDTLPFADIVANADGALAVITGNFRTIGDAPYFPIGHVMINGEMLFTSTYSTLGITADGEMRYGRPNFQVWMRPTDTANPAKHWIARGVNVTDQAGNGSVLYTPYFGDSFTVKISGTATTVRNGVVTACVDVADGDVISIPADGYVLLLSRAFESLYLYKSPAVGQTVELEYFLGAEDAEGFTLDGVEYMISGAPRLVQDGEIVTTLESTFSDSRFTGNKSSRTAVGTTADGMLILVSVPSASTQQMRELMLTLGCVDAINLDGGASTGFYYSGTTYRTPSRELITTIQIFVD